MSILKKGKNIIIACDDDLSTSDIIRGYAFLSSSGECVCEYIYYFNDLSLEVFDLSECETYFYINTFVYDMEEIFEQQFYWG